MASCKAYIIYLCIFSLFLLHETNSTEFEVGDTEGWQVPPSKNPQVYNEWAQKNRFKINDTLEFKYKKDSVMVVTDEEYDKCRSSRPVFFANNGETEFVLDRAGLFYFISGVSGHCERGQKMIVKVLDVNDTNNTPPNGDNNNNNNNPPGDNASDHKKGGAPSNQFKFVGFPALLVVMVLGFLVIMN